MLIGGGAAFYVLDYRARHESREYGYVLPPTVTVVDTPAEVRVVVDTLKAGDRFQVLKRTPRWLRIRTPGGHTGWVEIKDILDADTYEKGQNLAKELSRIAPQALGHTEGSANLHLGPSRDSLLLAELAPNLGLEIYGRKVVARPAQPDQPAAASVKDAWYLVRAGFRAGWVLGRLVDLDVPKDLAPYAQTTNMVAWVVLRRVPDAGRQVPEYVVADRIGPQEFDFNHIRVLTWWKKHREYVTAYVEGQINGYFPIRVSQVGDIPYFRLREVDSDGHKFQKVYGLFDTIVRPIGTVEGWENEAMPQRAPHETRRGKRAIRRR